MRVVPVRGKGPEPAQQFPLQETASGRQGVKAPEARLAAPDERRPSKDREMARRPGLRNAQDRDQVPDAEFLVAQDF